MVTPSESPAPVPDDGGVTWRSFKSEEHGFIAEFPGDVSTSQESAGATVFTARVDREDKRRPSFEQYSITYRIAVWPVQPEQAAAMNAAYSLNHAKFADAFLGKIFTSRNGRLVKSDPVTVSGCPGVDYTGIYYTKGKECTQRGRTLFCLTTSTDAKSLPTDSKLISVEVTSLSSVDPPGVQRFLNSVRIPITAPPEITEASWKTYKSADGLFQVDFPGTPLIQKVVRGSRDPRDSRANKPSSTLHIVDISENAGFHAIYSVAVHSLDKESTAYHKKQGLKALENDIRDQVEAAHGEIMDITKPKAQELPSLVYSYTAPSLGRKCMTIGVCSLIDNCRKVLELTVVFPVAEDSTDDEAFKVAEKLGVLQFVESLKL